MNQQLKSNREVYLDLAKFFAMILMVAGHSFFELANPDTYNLNYFPWSWWNFARGKTAPMFLFLSGAVHVFANLRKKEQIIRNDVFRKRILMAFVLLVIGYILNSPINSIEDFYSISDQKLSIFFQVNILHVFGVGLGILAVIYKLSPNTRWLMINSILAGFSSLALAIPFVNYTYNFLPLFISDYLNYHNGSVFVLFPYLSYLFFGTCFGLITQSILTKQNDITDISLIEKIVSGKYNLYFAILLMIIGIILTKLFIYLGIKINLRSDPGIIIRNVGIIIGFLFVTKKINVKSEKFRNLITTLSKRAIFIYVIHLFIIYGIGNIPGLKHFYGGMFNPPTAFLITFGVMISTILITLLIETILKNSRLKYSLLILIVLYWIYFLLQ